MSTEQQEALRKWGASLAALAAQAQAPNCARCGGSGEDPEGYLTHGRGPDDHTVDGPCRSCDGTGAAQPQAAQAVPEGWKLVPVEPTQEMVNAASELFRSERGHHAEIATPDDTFMGPSGGSYYEAMLAAAPSAPAQPELTQAARDVLAERQRQITAEGWTPEHDDEHDTGEMAGAAACYAMHVNARQWVIGTERDDYASEPAPDQWPWDEAWWKPKNPRRDAIRAAALLIAEVERLDRAAARKEQA